MLAIRQHEFGGPEQLLIEEVPTPHPELGQVLVAVEAAGVHLLDTVIRSGRGPARAAVHLPMTPGREVAGVVHELGQGTDPRLLGQRIVVDLGPGSGGYAEYALATEHALHVIDDALDPAEAVAAVGTGRTVQAIVELARIARGETVVITAAAGGVGTLLVQAATNAGASVVALAGSAKKTAHVTALGAGAAVDYSAPAWYDEADAAVTHRRAHLLLDGVGGEIGRRALDLLGVGGRAVMFGSASGTTLSLTAEDIYGRGITVSAAVGARLLRRPGGLVPLERRALKALADRSLVPSIGQRFPLSAAAAAHRAIEARGTIGKTVLEPG
jgi:NADPH2:quinone reductase